jgi:hypothetical protein
MKRHFRNINSGYRRLADAVMAKDMTGTGLRFIFGNGQWRGPIDEQTETGLKRLWKYTQIDSVPPSPTISNLLSFYSFALIKSTDFTQLL